MKKITIDFHSSNNNNKIKNRYNNYGVDGQLNVISMWALGFAQSFSKDLSSLFWL